MSVKLTNQHTHTIKASVLIGGELIDIIHIHAPQTDNPIIGRSSAPKTECKDRAVKWVTDNGKRRSINYDK
jgi:hypothetical protein